VCERCYKTTRSVHPSIEDSQIRLFCHSCAQKQ
jgi:hypothetical protein